MPTDPLQLLILQNLQTALRGIAQNAGYHYDLEYDAVKLDPDHDAERFQRPDGPTPFIYLEPGIEEWEYASANRLALTWPITINWVGVSETTDDTSRLATFYRGCADVERAIAQDFTRGGLVIDHTITGQTPFVQTDGGSRVWAQIATVVRLRRVYGAPNA